MVNYYLALSLQRLHFLNELEAYLLFVQWFCVPSDDIHSAAELVVRMKTQNVYL